MIELYTDILSKAEKAAGEGNDLNSVLEILRELPLEDFGLFFVNLPDRNYPHLSKLLPPMAAVDTQKKWTGTSGLELYRQTALFLRIVESNVARHRQRGLQDSTILDFGVGYGRIFRMMYYFSNPEKLWGVDAWQRSLDFCKAANMAGNFALSDSVPESLPVGDVKFDLMVSFSVFTHLEPETAKTCLRALRKHIAPDGLLMATIRPIEFWRFYDGLKQTDNASRLEKAHRENGFAYLPHEGAQGATYGDTSFVPEYLIESSGWRCLAVDRSIADPYQVTCVLSPV
tara:strand:- start:34265 stop:35122 length:858 start_codon:yes stop_codon:yes gene_type:complete